ncbi:MAG: FCD domain-containing protein, partial [Defluviitaleaceae bacterium]|nr:FCD domain-containing protein [Defluviitaleaceae bacterium]
QMANSDEFLKADFDFHMAIAITAQNSYLADMLEMTRDLLLEYNKVIIARPGQMQRAIESHYTILQAIGQQDAKVARQKMICHIKMIMK